MAMSLDTFEHLLHQEHRLLLAYARALVGDSAAEDVVQEASIVAYRRREDFREDGDFAAWMRGIIRFKCLEWRRKRRAAPLDPAVIDGIEAAHRDWSAQQEERRYTAFDALDECLRTLQAGLARLVRAVYVDGRTADAVAAEHGLSHAAARKRLQRSRAALSACITERLRARAR